MLVAGCETILLWLLSIYKYTMQIGIVIFMVIVHLDILFWLSSLFRYHIQSLNLCHNLKITYYHYDQHSLMDYYVKNAKSI